MLSIILKLELHTISIRTWRLIGGSPLLLGIMISIKSSKNLAGGSIAKYIKLLTPSTIKNVSSKSSNQVLLFISSKIKNQKINKDFTECSGRSKYH